MKVSVIVITWKAVDFLKVTVPKLRKQIKNYDSELIYVVNGSADGSLEYLKKFSDIKLIENSENQGISIARNQGVASSKGEYLLLIDDDMLVEHEDYQSGLIEFYNRLENPGIMMPLFVDKEELKIGKTYSYGSYYYIFGINTRHKKQVSIEQIVNYPNEIPIAISQGGAMFMSRRVWDDLGGFDTSQKFNLDDDDISTRANVFGYTNYLYNKNPIVHLGLRKRQDKNRYAFNDKTYISGKCKAMLKNFSLSSLLLVFPLSFSKMLVEGLYHTIVYRHFPILLANILSVFTLIRDLPDTLNKRKYIQSRRTRPDRDFLWIKSPQY